MKGLDQETLAEYVDSELRGKASSLQLEALNNNKKAWRTQLIKMKQHVEGQMTACSARSFTNYKRRASGELTFMDYLKVVETDKKWKVNATRFIAQIESRMADLRNANDLDSTETEGLDADNR